jgi:hypothetical protein
MVPSQWGRGENAEDPAPVSRLRDGGDHQGRDRRRHRATALGGAPKERRGPALENGDGPKRVSCFADEGAHTLKGIPEAWCSRWSASA